MHVTSVRPAERDHGAHPAAAAAYLAGGVAPTRRPREPAGVRYFSRGASTKDTNVAGANNNNLSRALWVFGRLPPGGEPL